LFFPKVENREKLFERIRKNFVRLSDELGLYEIEDGRKRPIYVYRHSFITGRRKKGVDVNVLALHSNNSTQMINQHYSVLSDDHLLEIHNQVFPERERTKKTKNWKVITKKWPKDYVPYYVPFQKVLFSVINYKWAENRTPLLIYKFS